MKPAAGEDASASDPAMLARRVLQLFAGLALCGVSLGLMIRANLGLDPWDVFHQGVADRLPLSFGTIVIAVGFIVLLLWIPLRQRPGFGTVVNVLMVGLVIDASLAFIPDLTGYPLRIAALLASILLLGIGTAAYIGAGLGPGPRDGLMTGLVARTGWPVRSVRTWIEVAVLVVGWAMGGTVGIGTLIYAFTIGPIVQVALVHLTIEPRSAADPPPVHEIQ